MATESEPTKKKDRGVIYEIHTDDLEALIDSQLHELGFAAQIDKSVETLASQVKQQESESRTTYRV